jgi:hypothetical protein
MCEWNLDDVEAAPGIWCDPCIVPLVQALNAGGVRTVASCCGHGRNVGSICLADGRVLAILPGLDALDATIIAVQEAGQ